MLETPNGIKLLLVTSVRADSAPDNALNNLYDLYINLVKRNYLYKSG